MISKFSIAVLPFVNMSPDKDNEYFSDGITEQVINALCKYGELHVTSRTSSFIFKNQPVDVREIGKKLNVYYILEGSVRRSGEWVRITAQLVKAEDGFHLWSESWDRELKDIFILQDEMAGIIAGMVNTELKPPKQNKGANTGHSGAIELYLRGLYFLNQFDIENHQQIISYFEQAIALDPAFEKARN